MTLQGKWRIIEIEAWDKDFLDLVEPAYILFGQTSGEFAFGCITGAFAGGGDHDAVEFDRDGNDEMDEARGGGWAELQDDGSLAGEITFPNGDESGYIGTVGRLLQQLARGIAPKAPTTTFDQSEPLFKTKALPR